MNTATRSDACEQAAKEAKLRAEKAEEEVTDLLKKATQLEVDFSMIRLSPSVCTYETIRPFNLGQGCQIKNYAKNYAFYTKGGRG